MEGEDTPKGGAEAPPPKDGVDCPNGELAWGVWPKMEGVAACPNTPLCAGCAEPVFPLQPACATLHGEDPNRHVQVKMPNKKY